MYKRKAFTLIELLEVTAIGLKTVSRGIVMEVMV